jgi:hypothetical protein
MAPGAGAGAGDWRVRGREERRLHAVRVADTLTAEQSADRRPGRLVPL